MNSKDSGLKKISNPPFKSFIDYRIGDYNTFRKLMLTLIKENRLLGGASILKSDKSDYGRALVDMWAYLCDILTYYQERIATESFLRTAGLEESAIELLYLVDYLPRRGRSASTLVRFTADEKNIRPTQSIVIPKGFKIRSVPAKGQESIIFETDESLVVSSDHNLMKLDGWRTSYKIERGTTQLVLDKIYPELSIGDLVMISNDENIDVVRITKKVDKDGKSQIAWAQDRGLSRKYNLSNTKIQKFTQVVRPFGHNAPPSILSNVGVILYKKNPGDNSSSNNSTNTDESRKPISGRRVQLVDVSDRVIASATSDNDGKFTFKGLIPGSYRILIARSQLLTDESYLHPITTISSNRFQLLPGFESWFETELEFTGSEIQTLANTWKEFSSELGLKNPFARDSFIGAIRLFSSPNLQDIADNLPDMRPSIDLKPIEAPYPFDPVNDDILSSEVYLDKVYGNIRQGSLVILSKDDPSDQIDISRQLFKVSRTGQMFHSKYGIGGNSSAISLQTVDRKKRAGEAGEEAGEEEEEEELIFCWNEILKEIELRDKSPGKEDKETKKLIDFLNQDTHSLDPERDILKKIENDTAVLVSDPNKKNVYIIKLDEKDEGKATLIKNDKKQLRFIVRKEAGGEGGEAEIRINLYARKIESAFYKIRNTLIFTNPIMELGVDPRYASQNKTKENAETITLEGMHTGLKDGLLLAINDNTSIIKGTVVDSNLRALNDYKVTIYRLQKQEGSSSVPTASIPIKVKSQDINDNGSFGFDGLRADSYILSLSLKLDKYWSIFVDHIFEQGLNEEEKNGILRELISPENAGIISHVSAKHSTSSLEEEEEEEEEEEHDNSMVVLEYHLNAFLKLIARIKKIIGNIDQELESKFHNLESKAQELVNRLPNDGLRTDELNDLILRVRELAEKTGLPHFHILEEILIIVKEALQSPFRSTIYGNNERLLGVTKMINLEPNIGINITMTFNIKDRLTYVESFLEHSKFQVTKIAGTPAFSEGKTHLNLNPPLEYGYVKGFAEIYGNIAPASHGETVKDEILGSGDAASLHQEFTLQKGPISYVLSPLSPNGIKSTLKVIVNDVQWQETDDFLSSSANDQHYVTSLNEDGTIKITFGDGIRGSTLPTGIDNVHAQYRVGIGFKGNLKPNTPVVPQENNPAIKSISIPAGSFGGSERILNQQKRSYRPHILTLGRAVSLEDYSHLATTFGEISKARAYLAMKAGQETVILVVAGQKGRIVNSSLQAELRAYMDERRDSSIPLEIESFIPVPVDIVVEVKVSDSYLRSKVVSDIQTRLGGGMRDDNNYDSNNDSHYSNKINISTTENQGFAHGYYNLFSFERLNFGQKVTLSEVYAQVENVPGVDFAVVRKFSRRDEDGAIGAIQEIINAGQNEILQCENNPLDPIKGTINILARGGVEL